MQQRVRFDLLRLLADPGLQFTEEVINDLAEKYELPVDFVEKVTKELAALWIALLASRSQVRFWQVFLNFQIFGLFATSHLGRTAIFDPFSSSIRSQTHRRHIQINMGYKQPMTSSVFPEAQSGEALIVCFETEDQNSHDDLPYTFANGHLIFGVGDDPFFVNDHGEQTSKFPELGSPRSGDEVGAFLTSQSEVHAKSGHHRVDGKTSPVTQPLQLKKKERRPSTSRLREMFFLHFQYFQIAGFP